jgi:rhodanese-related sulfurtransferase
MRKKFSILASALVLLFAASAGSAYDVGLAGGYAQLFAPVKGITAGKALHFMTVPAFVDLVKSGKGLVTVDVRTPAETGVFGVTLPNSLQIPIDQLFQPANLNRIPTDKPVVVICHSGARAIAAATALRHIGFDNVYILKGGLKELAGYLDAKTANMPVKKVASQ